MSRQYIKHTHCMYLYRIYVDLVPKKNTIYYIKNSIPIGCHLHFSYKTGVLYRVCQIYDEKDSGLIITHIHPRSRWQIGNRQTSISIVTITNIHSHCGWKLQYSFRVVTSNMRRNCWCRSHRFRWTQPTGKSTEMYINSMSSISPKEDEDSSSYSLQMPK